MAHAKRTSRRVARDASKLLKSKKTSPRVKSVAGSALSYWMNRQISALKGAIEAQKKIIAAQAEQMKAQGEVLRNFEGLTKTMQIVLESTDALKMLERYKAYKEIVDHEKRVTLQEQERQFAEEKGQMSQAQQRVLRDTTAVIAATSVSLIDLCGNLILYTPLEVRRGIVNSTDLPDSIKDVLLRLVEAAPDWSRAGLLGIGAVGRAELGRGSLGDLRPASLEPKPPSHIGMLSRLAQMHSKQTQEGEPYRRTTHHSGCG